MGERLCERLGPSLACHIRVARERDQGAPQLRAVGPDLAAYTTARLPRTRMVANGSYRATRLSGMTFPAAIALRNTGIRLAGRLAPGLMLRQMDPLASWTPPL